MQVLRAFAALYVVAGHSSDVLVQVNGHVPRPLAWLHGPVGVDIFFVISGFVMLVSSGRLLSKPHPVRLFLWRRWLRIAPLYWLLTTVRLVLLTLKPSLSRHALPSTWNAISSYLFIPSLSPSGEVRPVIPVGWTLSFEMMFYICFAWALLRPQRTALRVTIPMVLLALLALVRTAGWPVWTSFADPIVLEFLGGIWLAHSLLARKTLPRAASIAAIVLGAVALVALPAPGLLTRPLIWGVPALLLVGGSVFLEHRSPSRRFPRTLLLLGDASYSIYLAQMFVFPPLHMVMDHLQPGLLRLHPLAGGLELMLTSLLFASLVGIVVHLVIEKPMTESLRNWSGAAQPRPVTP